MPGIFTKTFKNVELFKSGAYFFHLSKGEMDTKIHRHNKSQFVYAEGGYLFIEIGEKVWFLPARHYMWIPAGVVHRIWSHSTMVKMYTIYFEVNKGEPAFYSRTGIYFVNDLLREMILFTARWDGNINERQYARFTFAQAIKAILPDLSSDKSILQFTLPLPKDERLTEIEAYIRQHLDEPLSIEQLAQKFGMAGRTLSRLFMQDLGMSYIRFLKTVRIIRAFELLVENKTSIKEIAFQLGYSSVPTFSNTFYESTGIRPTQYLG